MSEKVANEGLYLSLAVNEFGDQRSEQISFSRKIDSTPHEPFIKLLNGAAIELARIDHEFSETERPDRSIAASSEER
ncbi:MAG TPA: hypothetical protein VFV14_05135 [Myxococcaceae bacterium]|nr:hypothetical protein [Myxococcaceae bacterium]